MSAPNTPPPLAPYSDVVLERLSKLHPKLIDLSLERVHRLLAALGHPEERLPPVIHIAGTNGKGSALAFLKAMLEADGKAVHAYTSPHLVHFHERIYLGGKGGGSFIAEEALIEVLEECERANNGAPITYFEITTVAALLAFSRLPADALLLETGMGGRLDTTNVVARPAATLITPIGLDHQQFLGETLGEIAGEKAGRTPDPKKPASSAAMCRPFSARRKKQPWTCFLKRPSASARALISMDRTGWPLKNMAASSIKIRTAFSICPSPCCKDAIN